MKKPKKILILFITVLTLVSLVSSQEIISPDAEYSNNKTLKVNVSSDVSSVDNLTVNVSLPSENLRNIDLTEEKTDYFNGSKDISGVANGETIKVNVSEDSNDTVNSASFTVDREEVGFQINSPVQDEAYNESITLDIQADDKENVDYTESDYTKEYRIESEDQNFQTFDNSREIDLTTDQGEGSYTIIYRLNDSAGNSKEKEVDFTIDTSVPDFTVAISDGEYINETIVPQVDLTSEDESGIASKYYKFEGENLESFNNEFSLPDSLETGETTNLDITLQDNAGNSKSETISNLEVDIDDPDIQLYSPETERLNKTISEIKVNSTFNESTDSEISTSNSYFQFGSKEKIALDDSHEDIFKEFFNRRSFSEDNYGFYTESIDDIEGYLRGFYQIPSDLDDGVYDVEIGVFDQAGNGVVEGFEVGVSSEGPVPEDVSVNGSELESGGYIGSEGVVDFDVDWSGVAPANFSYNWEGDGDDGFETVNESSFNYDLGEDNYTLEIEATDYLGNTGSVNFSNVTVDNTVPSLGVERLTSSDWKSSHEVEVSCSREGSPVSQIGIRHSNGTMIKGWDTETEENYTLSEHGENTYNAVCQDEVGLENTEEFTVKVDKKFPEIANTTPEESATGVNVSETLRLDLNTNTTLSGVNSSLTTVNVSPGNITGTTITNQKVEAEVELPFEEYTTFSGTIYDQLNNTKEFETSFTTRDEPEDWTKIAETTNTSREMVLGVTNLDIGKETGRLNLELRESQSIQKIELQRNQSGEASMMVVEDQQRPTTIDERDGETYIYAAVEPRDISNDNITSANLTFHIEEDWVNQLELENPEFVVERFNSDTEEWEKLPTRVENGTEGIELTAETKHFSWFAPGTTQKQKGILDLIKEQLNKARSADLQNYITIFLITFIVAIILYLLYELGYIKLDIINVKIPKINH